MKLVKFLLLFLSVCISVSSFAQFRRAMPESLGIDLSFETIDSAKILEKQAIREARRKAMRERNIINGGVSLVMTQAGFDNWAKGGENSFTGKMVLDLAYTHKIDKLTMDTKLEARYGVNIIDGDAFKNEDKFSLNNQVAWSISERWSYSGILNLRSQFTKGYASRDDKTLKSNFMSPGYIDIAFGFKLKGPKSPLTLTLSPITGSITTVLYKPLQELGDNGVPAGHSTESKLGSSIQMDFFHKFFKEKVTYKSYFYSFYNYSIPANFRWTNTIEIFATNFITTMLYCDMIYDESIKTPNERSSLQLNYTLGLTLTKKFSNQK